jgi:dTDP-glucose 4,6-dehydratase
MKVLVSGSEGFIGSHVVEELVTRGHTVTAMVAYNFENRIGWLADLDRSILESVKLSVCDLRDASAVRRVVAGQDSIMHLGALIGIPYSYQAPDSYIQVNTQGTLNLLEASRIENIERFVHISTSEVYGSAQETPMSESHRIYPQSPYAASKAAADHFAQSYFLSFDLPVVTIRPFNTFGPRQSNRAVIPTLVSQFIRGGQSIKIGNLESRRDFTFVTDTSAGMIAGLEMEKIEGE